MGFLEKSSTRLTSGLHGRRCGGRDSADALGAGAPTGPMRSCAGQGWRRRGCGKICAPCMIRGSRTGKGGLRGKIFAQCIPGRLFAGLFGRMARESCQNQLISDAWRRYLATNRRFSRLRPLRERMRRKTATDRRPGTHHGDILPGPAERERIGPISCRCRTLGNAFREHFATGERPGLHRGIILPRPNACRTPRAPRPTAPNAPRLPLGSSSNTTPCAAAPSRHAPHMALSPPLKSKL